MRNDKTWSSNKIVEELYPTFQKEGNPIICYPVENYPLNVKATFSPKQTGEGDPSPDNVRPITGYDSVTVTQSKDEAQVKQITLTLSETIYGGTVDAATGVGEKTWEFVEFDGTENWLVDGDYYYCEDAQGTNSIDNPSLCNVAPFIDKDTPAANPIDKFFIAISGTGFVEFSKFTYATVEGFKSYLAAQASAGTPVQVAYKLATPEPFQATGNQALPAVAGLNTVYTDGDSLIISGKEDIKYTINQITSNIQNINQIQEINNILLGVE